MKARDLMTTSLVVVPPEMPVAGVAQLLASRGISAVPVADAEGKLLGLVTEGDLIRRLAEEKRGPLGWFLALFGDSRRLAERFAKAHGAKAEDVMTRSLVTVEEEATADEIARLMEKHQIRRVPVLRDGKLTGIVSRADLLRAVLAPPTVAPAAEATDTALLQGVLAAMREQPWVDTFYVFPDVKEGKVTLYGFHRSAEVQRGLEVLARAVPGVTAVEDRTEPMPFFLRASL
ncbi:CBS domain-containing protein [Roseicella aquatilis]|uniref:CBS domain-containing protein n=1 Tax=Roseicella aquatilis TaxID=2527868 RepID=A0A4R4DPT8_9PROT|nr:CBS domain-containing protein [Roseicella aquatilis]TCZ62985.1 CBS domain-containing protein [Roseicella aquatilis]